MSDKVPNLDHIDPAALVAALVESSFTVIGGRDGSYVRLKRPDRWNVGASLIVPCDRAAADYTDLMAALLNELCDLAVAGKQAVSVLDAMHRRFDAGWSDEEITGWALEG